MNTAFRQSFPPQHDLPPAMSALLAKLFALEANTAAAPFTASEIPTGKDRPIRETQLA
jgi:hypothetical protein